MIWLQSSARAAESIGSLMTGGLIAARFLIGILGPLVLVAMAWQTVRIRSTQSATGILYATLALTLFGELSAQLFARESGILL